ncbi:hypothetical protein GCM10022248_79240 [Nonomuraea soli]
MVVAVHDTMPYLTACLRSLVDQTIGAGRFEVIAVDDGSTDGGGAELDRFAAEHPGLFTVVHQPHSGGPAVPSNRGLDLATGRYVFFLGADDLLAPHALERLVDAADHYGSDVVLGKMVGINGRYVRQDVYARTDPDLDLYGSALPYAMSNTKLFRRRLLDRYRLRFPVDMPVGSDQPFTIEACVRAERISVLADAVYYYAVRRHDRGNITYRSSPAQRLDTARRLIEFTAGLLPAGARRDAVLARHFDWELSKLVGKDFARFDPETRSAVCAAVKSLSAAYLTGRILDRLSPAQRYRLALAARGRIDLLIQPALHSGSAPLVLEKERVLVHLPGFDEMEREHFVFNGAFDSRMASGIRVLEAAWSSDRLVLWIRAPVLGDGAAEPAPLGISGVPAEVTTELAVDGSGTTLCARIPMRALLGGRRHDIRLAVTAAGELYEFPLPALGRRLRQRRWHRGRPYRISVIPGRDEQMVVRVSRVPWRRALLWRKQ